MLTPLILRRRRRRQPRGSRRRHRFHAEYTHSTEPQRQRQQALLDTVRRIALGKHCPFLEFALEWEQGDSVSVRLTGHPGVKDFTAAEMGIAPDR